ncbi:MAG: hypothetical protein ACREPQ_13795 [Rhodanobacter sp.]
MKATRTIAIIAGTGLAASLANSLHGTLVRKNVSVPFGSRSGTVLQYVLGELQGLRVLILPRHGPTVEVPDRSPAELVRESGHEAHIWHFHTLGVEHVYGFNSVGAIDRSVPLASANSFLIPDDYGRGFGITTHSFGQLALDIHPSMASPFSDDLRKNLLDATTAAGAGALTSGLYIHSAGDAFESSAEVQAYRVLYQGSRNKVVGMTSGAEVVLCKQMKMKFALICASCNWAQGLGDGQDVTHEHVLSGMRPATDVIRTIAMNLIRIEALATTPERAISGSVASETS